MLASLGRRGDAPGVIGQWLAGLQSQLATALITSCIVSSIRSGADKAGAGGVAGGGEEGEGVLSTHTLEMLGGEAVRCTNQLLYSRPMSHCIDLSTGLMPAAGPD